MAPERGSGPNPQADRDLHRVAGQTALSESEALMPHDPKDVPCDWCGEPSVVAVELQKKFKRGWLGSGQFIYACRNHEQKAENMRFTAN
jgi:hypothetical protein